MFRSLVDRDSNWCLLLCLVVHIFQEALFKVWLFKKINKISIGLCFKDWHLSRPYFLTTLYLALVLTSHKKINK